MSLASQWKRPTGADYCIACSCPRGTGLAEEHKLLRLAAAALATMGGSPCSASTAAAHALALSSMVLVSGPDPKLAKATPRAFYHTVDGQTTVSSSGPPPLPPGSQQRVTVSRHSPTTLTGCAGLCVGSLVLCPASVVLLFLLESARAALLKASERLLVPGTR